MDIAKTYFLYKSFDDRKLIRFGFKRDGESFTLSRPVMDGQFVLTVRIASQEASSEVTEADTGERFTLYSVGDACGAFVGQMRAEAEALFEEIAEKCCNRGIFKGEQTKRIIEYAKQKYGNDVEYLWDRFPRNGVLRRRDNGKWYAAILSVERRKIGLEGDGIAEVIDLRGDEYDIKFAVENEIWLPAYHMNKKYWFTVCLDDGFKDEKLFKLIDESYDITKNK